MHELSMERRDVIASRLRQGMPVVANALAREFDVSEDAIRRDLRVLADAGVCRRVYGGALPLAASVLPMAVRLQEGQDRKRALARAALATLRPGEFLFLDSSSANVELARLLPPELGLSVATNSIDVAATLLQRSASRLLLLGGVVDPLIGGSVDATAVAAVAALNIDRCFVGACAVAADGVSVVDPADAVFKRAVLAASRHALALITADKLETRAPHRIAAVGAFDALIVEHQSAEPLLAAIARAGGHTLRAGAPAAS